MPRWMRAGAHGDPLSSGHCPEGACPNPDPEPKVGQDCVAILLLRPCEVSSRIAHAAILKVADDAFGALLKHRHMFIGSVA